MLNLLPHPAVIAHRGSSTHAPENTLASFWLAAEQKADAIEFDVRLSRDDQIVVIHDRDVNRTTDGQGKVSTFSVSELMELDAGNYFDPKFKNEKIPTLKEVLSNFGNSILLNIEIKTQHFLQTGLPIKVARMIMDSNLIERSLISSFNPFDLIVLRRYTVDIELGLLVPPGINRFWVECISGNLVYYDSIHFDFRDINEDLIDKYHKKGKTIFAYTVNDIAYIQKLIDIGIDGIFTDNPLLVKQLLYKIGSTCN